LQTLAVWNTAGLHAWNSRVFFKQRKRWANKLNSLAFVVDEPATLRYYKWIHRFWLVPIWFVFNLGPTFEEVQLPKTDDSRYVKGAVT